MKKCNKNIDSNNNQMVFKSKISFNNNITNIEKNKENNDYNHFRYKTEPLKKKLSNLYLKTISKYFEESLNILQTIQQNLTISVDNNNKPLLKKKMKLNNQKKNNHYIKLSSMEKFDMAKTIIDNSNNRKEQYLEMFLLINSSIDEVRNLLMNDLEDLRKKEKVKDKYPFLDDISSITLYNFSESEINESKNITEIFKKDQINNTSLVNKTDESSTIYNDDSYNEIQIKSIPIQTNDNLLNSNLYSAVTTSNTNPNVILISQEKIRNKILYTEGNNNYDNIKENKLGKIDESKKYSKDDCIQNNNGKRDCIIF